jgi:hypothetical protein
MGQAIAVRTDFTAGQVRQFAKRAQDAAQARRLLAIAAVLDGASLPKVRKILYVIFHCLSPHVSHIRHFRLSDVFGQRYFPSMTFGFDQFRKCRAESNRADDTFDRFNVARHHGCPVNSRSNERVFMYSMMLRRKSCDLVRSSWSHTMSIVASNSFDNRKAVHSLFSETSTTQLYGRPLWPCILPY